MTHSATVIARIDSIRRYSRNTTRKHASTLMRCTASPAKVREKEAEVFHHADDAGRHDQGNGQQHRPDEKERHQFPGAVLEGLAKIDVSTARARHRRAEFGPDHAVACRQDRAGDPADQRLRTAHHGDHQRNGDERPDAAHLRHVDRSAGEQADRTMEAFAARRIGGFGGLHVWLVVPDGRSSPDRLDARTYARDAMQRTPTRSADHVRARVMRPSELCAYPEHVRALGEIRMRLPGRARPGSTAGTRW